MTGEGAGSAGLSPESSRSLAFAEYRLAQAEEQIAVMQRSGESPTDRIEAEVRSLRDEIRQIKQEDGLSYGCSTQ